MTNVVNPSPVPIRLRSATAGAYNALNAALREAADRAERTAAHESATEASAADWRAVRDALRNAATEALVPRGGTGRPRCRRCSIDCPYCGPAGADARARADVFVATLLGHPIGHACSSCDQAREIARSVEQQPERDGMSHLYDCCPAAPTEPHTPECERNS